MPATDESRLDYATLAEQLRRYDRDRYLMALFAPAERRGAVMALYAFNYEIARIRESVSQPLLGQIRLQWWREGIEAAYSVAAVRKHGVLEPLAKAIRRYRLTREHFDRLIDARERDLADEPPATLALLETYAEETGAPLQFLTLELLGIESAAAMRAAREAAIAYSMAGLLRATPFLARQRRFILPKALVEEAGLDVEALFAGRASSKLADIAGAIAERAAAHLNAARALQTDVPKGALVALLPAVLAAADLERLKRDRYDIFARSFTRLEPWRSGRLTWAALRGRY